MEKHAQHTSELANIASVWGIAVMWMYILLLPVFIVGEIIRQLYKKNHEALKTILDIH